MALSHRTAPVYNFIRFLCKNHYTNTCVPRTTLRLYSNNYNMSGEHLRTATGMKLNDITYALERFADIRLAESWDNVGLLIEPATKTLIENIMLTNDLTENVAKEAVEKRINLIISYHPPIFKPLKEITRFSEKGHTIALCLENRIAVYSPHTTWDSVCGGVTDWLADAFNGYLSEGYERDPIIPRIDEELDPKSGPGRLVYVDDISIGLCINLVKTYLGLKDLRVAFGKNKTTDSPIGCIAIVPGSGGSLLNDVNAHLFLTGEMSHHELLAANNKGTTVILTNHSNSERGFLKEKMCHQLEKMFEGKVNIMVSECDKDPLITV